MTGKVAIITGASEEIGAGLVAGYHARGWAVVASARTIRPAVDPDVVAVAGNVAESAVADRVIGTALERFGRIDTLVSNAGAGLSRPFTGYTAADYATAVEISLTGFFLLAQRAIAEMTRRYGGHVVTVLAPLAGTAESGTPAALTALTDGGLAAATRSLALEYAAYGIRVNAVSPGAIQTLANPAGSNGSPGGPLPRSVGLGQVSDVVAGVLFLESSPAVTGEILHLSGGTGGERA